MRNPPILCVTGSSGGGKTRLLERLIPVLVARGLRVGAMKHAGHLEVSLGGKDSDRLRAAGADPAVADGLGGCHVQGGTGACPADLVAAFCGGCDMVLAEGYGKSPYDKLLLVGGGAPRPTRAGTVRLRVGSGGEGDPHHDDIPAIAAWVEGWLTRRRALREGLIGAILAGGSSTRMGTDKSALKLAGRSILSRLYELLADRVGEACVAGRRPACDDLPVSAKWHMDALPGRGPLGGIAAALRIASAGGEARGVCVIACDMPALSGELLDHLLSSRDPKAPATVLVNPVGGQVEPLAGIYESRTAGPIEEALSSNRLSVTAWLESAGARLVPAPAHLADQLTSVNTPREWESLRLHLEGQGL
jgi:molybdopterin-guanine dinucleotide biosynthesis protein MobB